MLRINAMRCVTLPAIFGISFGLVIVFIFDYKAVAERGFFQGYSNIVWVVIILQVRAAGRPSFNSPLGISRQWEV